MHITQTIIYFPRLFYSWDSKICSYSFCLSSSILLIIIKYLSSEVKILLYLSWQTFAHFHNIFQNFVNNLSFVTVTTLIISESSLFVELSWCLSQLSEIDSQWRLRLKTKPESAWFLFAFFFLYVTNFLTISKLPPPFQ